MKKKDEKLWNKVAGRTDIDRAKDLADYLKKHVKKREQTHHWEDFRKFLHSIGIHRSTGKSIEYLGDLELSIRKCRYCDKLMVIKLGFHRITKLKVIAFFFSCISLGIYAYYDSTGPIKYLVLPLAILGLTYILIKQASECD